MIFSRYLDSRGDGTGVKNANGLYADSVVTFTNGTDLVNLATHGFVTGDGPFTFTTSASLPAELAVATDYYIGPTVAAGTFDLSLTRGGATVPFTDDGSGTNTLICPFRFYIKPAAGKVMHITRVLAHIRDTAINADDYGAISGSLTNGITVKVVNDSGTIIDLTDGVTIKTSADWARVCYDAVPQTWGAGDEFLSARWTFTKSGEAITLQSDTYGGADGLAVDKGNERLEVTLHDDLGGLVEHYFLAQGND